MSSLITIEVDRITVGRRHRTLKDDRVDALAHSIEHLGLQAPITVSAVHSDDTAADPPRYVLVAGLHRLEAVKRLGQSTITAIVPDLDDLDRELWEIDENLVRAELTELEKGQHLARRKKIFEARHPETRHGGDRRSSRHDGDLIPAADSAAPMPPRFTKDAAERTGMSERQIQRAVQRAKRIVPEVQGKIVGTPLADNGAELDALAAMSPEAQQAAVRRVLSGEAASVRNGGSRAADKAAPVDAAGSAPVVPDARGPDARSLTALIHDVAIAIHVNSPDERSVEAIAASLLRTAREGFRQVLVQVEHALDTKRLDDERRAAAREALTRLGALFEEEADPFPGLTGAVLKERLEAAGLSVEKAARRIGWKSQYLDNNITHNAATPLPFAVRNRLRPLHSILVEPKRLSDPARPNHL